MEELYQEARQEVVYMGIASPSFLQRKLQIGYAQASKLLDMLEERGVIGEFRGMKPREILEKSNPIE